MRGQQLALLESVGDPHARRDDDFYETFVWQTEALLKRVYLHRSDSIIEPCAGNGAISKRLLAQGLTVWSNDLVQRDYPLDSTLDAATMDLWQALTAVDRRVDVVITNVPFSLALPIIDQSIRHARLFVASLLRSTWDEPTEARGEWLKQHPPTAQIAMPRADYRGTGNRDSTTHHWFIWSTSPKYALFGHHDTVTAAERDALIAQFGDGQ